MSNTETYIVSAKTVDEAMAIAQREYGGAGKDISFDILEMPKKGFLGIGAKDAKIKVTVTEEEEINLGSIVAEMKSYRLQTDRDGGEGRKSEKQPRGDKAEPRQDRPEKKQEAPKAEQKQQKAEPKPAQPRPEKANQDKPAPKQDKPVQKQESRQNAEKPAPKQDAPRPERKPEAKPAQPRAEKANQDKPAPKQDKPVQKQESRQNTEKPAPKQDAPKSEKKPEAKPAFDTSRAGEKPEKKEARASGILDNMPEYKITESGKKTPVYRETGANVKTYAKNPMHTAAVADGSIISDGAPVADVRWDSARDLKKAEEAAAAAMAAASRAAAPDGEVKENIASRQKPINVDRHIEEAIGETFDETGSRYAAYREQAEEAGRIDIAALDAAIEAMVEELPAPESRKKTGITAAEMEYALSFVTTLLANMQINAKAIALPCPEGEEYEIEGDANVYPAMEIVGDGTGILIGHHGETLDAIQYLLNLAAIRHSDNPNGDYVKISLDIENYRAKREETLRSLARRMAARALKYKRNVFLEPMNAYERRIIHSELQNVENVSTHSVGTDKNRKIIITYEGPDKVFDDRRRSGNGEGAENRRRDHGRGRRRNHDAAPAEEAVSPEATEGEETRQNVQPAGEHKSRSRNRNRNRNRRRHSENSSAEASEVVEVPLTGASAIISGEEREALDRQLTDPSAAQEKQSRPAQPAREVPAFLQQSSDEPVEHLREN